MTTRTPLLLLALLGALFAFSACEEGGEAVEASAPCTVGEPRSCEVTGIPACFGTMICGGDGVFGSCVVGNEICGDGVDNNCNLQVDEGCTTDLVGDDCTTVNQVDTCLTSCDSVGTRKCGANKKWSQCIPPEEICNNLDDNCNTVVDDGVSRACSTKCGQGIEICDKGEFKNCTAPPENPEICDGQDNDCDGKVDTAANGTPLEVPCTGTCGPGSQVCAFGQLGACSSNGTAEICNNLDDDCNGIVDDVPGGCSCGAGQTQLCGSDLGECSQGIQECLGGQWSACKTGVHGGKLYTFNQGSDEACDLLDNDCDGETDEGNPGGGAACGTQNGQNGMQLPCQLGLMSCLNGELTCIGGVDPEPEICDDIDNDCDGLTDEENSADNYESNNSCQNGTYETVTQGAGKKTLSLNLYPEGDFDWLEIKAKELADFCFNDDSEGPYQFTVKMTPPPGLDYDLCVWPADSNSCGALPVGGGPSGNCDNLGIFIEGPGSETYTYPPAGQPCWDGGCGDNDDKSFYIKVFAYYASDEDCAPYTLELEMVEIGSENCAPVVPADVCGNGDCESSESEANCPSDCAPPDVCGNGVCESSESEANCPSDCAPAVECDEVCKADCASDGELCVESCAGPCLQGCASEFSACNASCGGFPSCLGDCSSDNNACVEGCSVGNNTCEMGCGLTEASCTSDCGC